MKPPGNKAKMSTYIDAGGQLRHDQEANLALTCPHCQVLSHITPIAVPGFDELVSHRPQHVGVIYRCDACNAPIFLRYPVKMFGSNRLELGAQFSEVERASEKFCYTYLPEEVELLFRETLACYSQACYNAFASMCRRTMQAAFADLGETGKLRVFDHLNDVRVMADLDGAAFADTKRVIFGSDNDPYPDLPTLDDQQAGVLVEVVKDLLYQVYVRKGRLQQAMMMRRFFADESIRKLAPPKNTQSG
jgi:hypothetical protein